MGHHLINHYEELGRDLCRTLDVVPRRIYWAGVEEVGTLNEYLADIVITFENGEDINEWVGKNIHLYKEAVNWDTLVEG